VIAILGREIKVVRRPRVGIEGDIFHGYNRVASGEPVFSEPNEAAEFILSPRKTIPSRLRPQGRRSLSCGKPSILNGPLFNQIGAGLEEVGKFTWFWSVPRPVRVRTGASTKPSTRDWRSWWEARRRVSGELVTRLSS